MHNSPKPEKPSQIGKGGRRRERDTREAGEGGREKRNKSNLWMILLHNLCILELGMNKKVRSFMFIHLRDMYLVFIIVSALL